MNVLITIDSFKGSLNSQRAEEAITVGIRRVFPDAFTEIITMADGGEGTVEAIIKAGRGKAWTIPVTSPIGEIVEAILGQLPDGTVVLEMAAASGLPEVMTAENITQAYMVPVSVERVRNQMVVIPR